MNNEQVGATDIVYYNMNSMPDDPAQLKEVRAQVEAHGLRLSCVEGGPPMDRIILGVDGRDLQIENFKACLRAMGEAGIPILCCECHWAPRVHGTAVHRAPLHCAAVLISDQSPSSSVSRPGVQLLCPRAHTYLHAGCAARRRFATDTDVEAREMSDA